MYYVIYHHIMFVTGMKFYTVMEYLPIQLTEETAETDDMNTLWNRIKSLTAGLHHLHQHGIFHGDLKPNNLCLRNKDEIVLIDFGMSGTGSMKITGFLSKYHPPVVVSVGPDSSHPVYEVNQSWDVGAYGVILFDLTYIYTKGLECQSNTFETPEKKEYFKRPFKDMTEANRREYLINLFNKSLGNNTKKIVEIIVQCTHHYMNKRPSMSTVHHILHEIGDYKETQSALMKFCNFAKIMFEERMLYKSWYEELIEAVPNDKYRQALNQFINGDFPYLVMSRRAVVDDITFLANAYRAAHPHTP